MTRPTKVDLRAGRYLDRHRQFNEQFVGLVRYLKIFSGENVLYFYLIGTVFRTRKLFNWKEVVSSCFTFSLENTKQFVIELDFDILLTIRNINTKFNLFFKSVDYNFYIKIITWKCNLKIETIKS